MKKILALLLLVSSFAQAQTKYDYSYSKTYLRLFTDSALGVPTLPVNPPTDGSQGTIYRNQGTGHFRFLENGVWVEYATTDNFIKNQQAVYQTANFKISGDGEMQGKVIASRGLFNSSASSLHAQWIQYQVSAAGENGSDNGIAMLNANSVASTRAVLLGQRSRGTLSAPLAVQNNDWLFGIVAAGFDANNARQTPAAIEFKVDGVPGAGTVPARIELQTGTWGGDRTTRLTLDNLGVIIPSLMSGGTAPTTSGTVMMIVSDALGRLSFRAVPGGGGGSGTVTSVGASVSGALGVTGGPITTAGTLAFAWQGTNTQYVAGDGSLNAFPTTISGITADNGLTVNTSTNVRLGGTLMQATTVNSGGFQMNFQGANVSQPILNVINTSNGTALAASSSSSYGATVQSNSSIALITSGTLGAQMTAFNSTAGNVVSVLDLIRSTASTAATANTAGAIDYYINTSTLASELSNRLVSKWADATEATRSSQFEIWGVNNAVTAKKADIASNGGLTVYSTQTTPTTGPELNTNPDGWTVSGVVTAAGSGGRYNTPTGSGSISYDFGPVVVGDVYILTYYITFPSTSSTFAGASGMSSSSSPQMFHTQFKAVNTSGLLTINISGSTVGYIEQISFKKLIAPVPISFATNTENATNAFEVRSDAKTDNLSIGLNAGRWSINQIAAAYPQFGVRNVAIGSYAMELNTVGGFNTAVGWSAMQKNTEGDNNVAIGTSAMTVSTTASYNTGVGAYSLFRLTTGTGNTGVGTQVLQSVTTGSNNTAVGYPSSGNITTGSFNTAIGCYTFSTLSTGTQNVAIGYAAGQSITTGSANISIGQSTLGLVSTGTGNIAIGQTALYNAANTGNYNIALGNYTYSSIYNSATLEVTQFRGNTSDNNNIVIGNWAWKNTPTNVATTGSVAIGSDARFYQDNQVVLGGNDISSTYLKGKTELRDFTILASNSLADNTFPAGTTKWSATGAVTLGTNKATFDLNSSSSGTLTQTAANLAIAGKGDRWYKMTMSCSTAPVGSPNQWSTFTVTLSGSTFASTSLDVYQPFINGSATVKIYFKAKSAPTDVTLSFAGTKGGGTGILDVTNVTLQEVTGGDMFVNRNLEVYNGAITLTKQYTPTSSTDNTYPIGTVVIDNNYTWYRKSDGTWVKQAWSPY